MNNESVAWTACLDCGKRVTGNSIHTCSPQLKTLTDAIETLENLLDIADNGIKEGYKTMNSYFVIEEIKQAILEIRKAQEK
jgi:hypothetical protein